MKFPGQAIQVAEFAKANVDGFFFSHSCYEIANETEIH